MSAKWLPGDNVLLEVGDASMAQHERALRWFEPLVKREGWAACPLTQNGFVRILMQAVYPGGRRTQSRDFDPPGALRAAKESVLFPGDISIADNSRFNWDKRLGTKQLTDAHLFALAIKPRVRPVTFDQCVDAAFARSGVKAMEIIP